MKASFPRIFSLEILLSALLFSNLLSQTRPGVWQTFGPEGAISVTNILALPTTPPTVYAGGGVGGLFKSTTGGITWESADPDLQNIPIGQIFYINQTIFVTEDFNSPLHYSTNGEDWYMANLPEIVIQNQDFINNIINMDGILLASTGLNGVLRSEDGGSNWTLPNSSLGAKTVNTLLAVGDTVYAGTGRPFLSHPADGIYYSTDQGVNWSHANPPMDTTEISSLYSLGGIIFAGTNKTGIFRSSDGINWNQTNAPMNQYGVPKLFSSSNNIIYAGLDTSIVYMSEDLGNNWSFANLPLGNQQVISSLLVDGTLYVGTARNGVFSTMDGLNWVQADPPLDVQENVTLARAGNTIYAAGEPDGIFRTDDGRVWFPTAKLPSVADMNHLILNDDFLLATSFSGVYRSVDGGLSWQRANPPMDVEAVRAVTYFKNILIASTVENGVFISSNGLDWTQANSPVNSQYVLTFYQSDGKLYAGTEAAGVFFTEDGLNWIQANPPINDAEIISFIAFDNALYASAHGRGLYRSSDGGYNWSLIDSPLNDNIVFPLISDGQALYTIAFPDGVINLSGYIFLLFSDPTMYKSEDGLNWVPVAIEQPYRQVKTLFSFDSVLYLGYLGAGTFRSNDGGSSWERLTAPWDFQPMQRLLKVGDVLFSGGHFGLTQIYKSGVYRSVDNGDTWTPLNKGFSASGSLMMPQLDYYPQLNRLYAVGNGVSFLELDFTPPVARSLGITEGSSFTADKTISLVVLADDADSMAISEDSTFSDSIWQEYSQVANFGLSPEDGPKTIYARFKDFSWNISDAIKTRIILDTSPPEFEAHTPPPDGTVGETVNFVQSVIEDNPLSTDLYFRRIGEPFSENRKSVFSNDSAQVDGVFITNRGIDYRIISVDQATQKDTLRNGGLNFFSLPIKLKSSQLGSSPGFPGGTGGSAYRIFSVPMNLEGSPSITSVVGSPGKYGTDGDWLFWNYDGNSNWQQGEATPLRNGAGYFLLLRNGANFTNQTEGTAMKTTAGVLGNVEGWQLRGNDWTLIGNPYNVRIELSELKLKNRNKRLNEPDSTFQVWGYDGRNENNGWSNENLTLGPWGGLAVFSTQTDTIVFNNPQDPFAPPSPPALVQTNLPASSQENFQTQEEWLLNISATTENYSDKLNMVGVRQGAKNGHDIKDWYEPPMIPGGVSVNFPHPEWGIHATYTSDIRPLFQEGYEWNLNVKAKSGTSVELSFVEVERIPENFEIWLIDDETKIIRNLRDQPQLRIRISQNTNVKPLRLLVGNPEYVRNQSGGLGTIPTSFALRQNYPNPFNPTTVIRYELPVSGQVTLKVYDVLGKVVQTVEDRQPREPGYYEDIVNLQGYGSGMYFYRINVQGEQRFQEVKKMLFLK